MSCFLVQLFPLEEDLRRCRREQQEAQLRGRQLEQKVEELEERNVAAMDERERQVKLMEVKTSLNLQLVKLKMQRWLPLLPHSKKVVGSIAPSGFSVWSLHVFWFSKGMHFYGPG